MFIATSLQTFAQYKVRFIVRENLPPVHDNIIITGNFSNWYPGDKRYLMKPLDNQRKSIVLDLPAGICEFKFTRGDWLTVQKDHVCGEMENNRVVIHRDTVINITISTWMDECNTAHFLEVLKTQQEDSNKVNSLFILCQYQEGLDKSLQYANEALLLSKKIKFRKGEGNAYRLMGINYALSYKYNEARKAYANAVKIQGELQDKSQVARTYLDIANTYNNEGNYPEGQQNTYEAIKYFEQADDKLGMANAYSSIGDYESFDDDSAALHSFQLALGLYGEVGAGNGTAGVAAVSHKIASIYLAQGKYPEALQRDSVSLKIYKELAFKSQVANTLLSIGSVFNQQSRLLLTAGDEKTSKHKLNDALQNYQEAFKLSMEEKDQWGIANASIYLGNINIRLKNFSIGRDYLEKSLKFYKQVNNHWGMQASYFSLSRLDSIEGKYRQAYNNYKLSIIYEDSLNDEKAQKKMVQTKMQYAFDKKEAVVKAAQDKKDDEARRTKSQQYLTMAALAFVILAVVVIATIQYRNNLHKQKANLLLQQQKEKVEKTLSELKSAQAQLIQSEKMASLGELTAGIAHEIQNPLNFVNNFSEVNNELIDEAGEEINKGNISEAKLILNDIRENGQKINHHGKRADAIVKGMLQHSRSSTAVKEPTDINKLADEYLRLAYHGLRAKDKSFNATLKTEFDQTIGNINVIPQDIGRAVLNLITNAFYAVNEKSKHAGVGYEPTVSVSTKKKKDNIEITVADNGSGISQKVVEKIFQPFFTTKPTGQGTGLGLSLSYDIVKAHGGELKVETKEGEGSEFIIQLSAT